MAIELRSYQTDCVAALRASFASGRRAPLLVLPTGGGKTIVFCEVTRGALAKGRRVLVVVHRRELIKQASAKLASAGVPHGIIAAEFPAAAHEMVQLGSIQTLARRLATLPAFDLLVFDEAHHCRAEQWHALHAAQPGAKLLGVTATPLRLDGRGLGIEAGGPFDDLVVGPSVAELIAGGYLSAVRCFVPAERIDLRGVHMRAGDYATGALAAALDRPAITGDAVEQYRRRAGHRAAIAFCTSVAHAEHVAEAFRDAGYRAACAHGGMAAAERDFVISGLDTADLEIIASCDLISEGLDVPNVGCVILLRPTKSLALCMQQVGRGMRPAPGKDALIVLDHVGNVLAHGLPDADRNWSLDGIEKDGEAPIWSCAECGCINPISARECEDCGYARPVAEPEERGFASAPGDLAEVTAEQVAAASRMGYREMLRRKFSEPELRAFAKARGYRRGWVKHRLREQAAGAAA